VKPTVFVAAQFFILNLAFAMFFDPIGISFALLGMVWIMHHKLAYAEAIIIFVAKGGYGFAFIAGGLMIVDANALGVTNVISVLRPIVSAYALGCLFLGFAYAAKLSGQLLQHKLKRKAPDLLEILTPERRNQSP